MAVISDVFDGRSQYTLRLTVTQTSQNISANQSTVSWLLEIIETSEWGSWSGSALTWSININGSSNSGSTTYNFNNYNSLTLGSGTKTITHNSDGTKNINFSMSAGGGTTIGAASDSGSMPLTTIPRASSSSFSPDNQINAGESVTINTNRASTSFTHTITYTFGGASGTIGTGVGASVSWTPSLSLMNEIPNATSGVGTVTTKTYNGGTLIGTTSVNFRLHVPASIVPDFTAVTHSEATAGVAANVGAYVQQVSALNLAITGAAGAYSSTITSYEIKVISAGVTRQTINAQSGTTSPIMVSGTVTLQGKITDSRGRTKTKTVDITVLAWAPPVPVDINVQRSLLSGTPDEEGTYIRVNINATISSLMNTTQRNSLGYRISTRPRDTTTWTLKTTQNPGGTAFNGSSVVGTYPVTESYDVLVEVFDDFATTAVQLVIATSAIFMHWGNRALGQGLGIGKFWEYGAVDVAGAIHHRSGEMVEPVGMVTAFAGSTAPVGWALCDGGESSRTEDAALFAIIGTTYGAGNGSTTFNRPNLKGRVIAGRDAVQSEFDTLGESGGAKTHTLTNTEMPKTPVVGIESGARTRMTTGQYTLPSTGAYNLIVQGNGDTLVLEGGQQPHNNLQPYLTLNYIIKL